MCESTIPRLSSIYVLRDSARNIRYVGITLKPLHHRLKEHLWYASHGYKSHKDNWIRSLTAPPTIELIETTYDRTREIYWIAFYRKAGCRLTNSTDGGEGAIGRQPTEEERRRLSSILRARFASGIPHPMMGRRLSKETKAKMADARRGKKRSSEAREKQRCASTGRRHTEVTREKIRQKIRESFPCGRPSPMAGKHHTDVARAKMSAQVRKRDAEKPRLPVSALTRAKLRAATLGVCRKHSPETKAKMAISQQQRRARERGEAQ